MPEYNFKVTATNHRGGENEHHRGRLSVVAEDEDEAKEQARKRAREVFPGYDRVACYLRG